VEKLVERWRGGEAGGEVDAGREVDEEVAKLMKPMKLMKLMKPMKLMKLMEPMERLKPRKPMERLMER
jgi:hypothetical protein